MWTTCFHRPWMMQTKDVFRRSTTLCVTVTFVCLFPPALCILLSVCRRRCSPLLSPPPAPLRGACVCVRLSPLQNRAERLEAVEALQQSEEEEEDGGGDEDDGKRVSVWSWSRFSASELKLETFLLFWSSSSSSSSSSWCTCEQVKTETLDDLILVSLLVPLWFSWCCSQSWAGFSLSAVRLITLLIVSLCVAV